MSELKDVMKEIIPTDDISLQQILNNLLDGTKNLDLKTHIFKPKQLASLVILSTHLKNIGLKNSAKIIDSFIVKYERYMVSFKRMSRKEIVKALSTLNEKEGLSTGQMLTTTK
ncbi:unnamed protein product [marine sediment metagenome]|uniref:Uncharacterized protein n=1 Tax=marine sediment metagenome TaxID=412755 RepID=X1GDQ4_9ZZZZ